MPVVLDPIGGSTDGWASIMAADIYFGFRLNAQALWAALNTSTKGAALLTAQRDLEFSTEFVFTDEDKETPSTAMQYAVCEQALFRLQDPDSDIRAGLRAQGVIEADLVGEVYTKGRGTKAIAPIAREMLAAFASAKGQIQSVPMYRKEAE